MKAQKMKQRFRGFTLVELLVVIAIIGILVGMLLPAIGAAREAARRAQCANNLSQLAIGVHQYEQSFRVFPAGVIDSKGPIANTPVGYHHSWICAILPNIEQNNAYKILDRKQSIYAAANIPVRMHEISILKCPSNFTPGAYTNYAGIHHDREAPIAADNNGLFFLNSFVPAKDVEDGLSHTAMISEMLNDQSDLGWSSGTRSSLRNVSGFVHWKSGWILPRETPHGIVTSYNQDGELSAMDMGGAPALDVDVVATSKGPDYVLSDIPPELWIDLSQLSIPNGVSPASFVGGVGAMHTAGVHFAFADGAVRFMSDSTDSKILMKIAHRKDGELPPSLR